MPMIVEPESGDTLQFLEAALQQLGCPAEKCGILAVQLDKRARQLSEMKGRTYAQALQHLLGLMQQGWVAGEVGGQPENTHDSKRTPSHSDPSPEPWEHVRSEAAGDFRIFKIRSDTKKSPRTGKEHQFYVLECVNWVNVVPLTEDGKIVMIEQYRHGSNSLELEIPGGMMDPHEHSALEAGVRELREETGYEGQHPEIIGEVFANPAIMSNTCYTLLVRNCRNLHETELDHGEDLVTRLVDVKDIPSLISSGRIKHSLVIVALYHFELWSRSRSKPASGPSSVSV